MAQRLGGVPHAGPFRGPLRIPPGGPVEFQAARLPAGGPRDGATRPDAARPLAQALFELDGLAVRVSQVGQPEDEPMFFGGCYFAGSGEREDTQAFVRSVLSKMLKQQADLQWAAAAIDQDRFYQKLAFLGFAADGVLAVAILVLLVLLLRGI